MSLTTVKRSDFPTSRTRCSKPKLIVSGRVGTIGFNNSAARQYELKRNDNVLFMKDADSDPADWYVIMPSSVTGDPEDAFHLSQSSAQLKTGAKGLARELILDFLRRKFPNKKDEEQDLNVSVHFTLATKPALDGDIELPDTYAIMGGVLVK